MCIPSVTGSKSASATINQFWQSSITMAKVFTHFQADGDSRRDELIRTIEHSVEQLTLGELEALYYDLVSKDYIRK
jgi:hypothetical protein